MYDDLARLQSVDCGSGHWGQNYTYDAFGNMNKAGFNGGTSRKGDRKGDSLTRHAANRLNSRSLETHFVQPHASHPGQASAVSTTSR